jgi:hypothetical protein
VDGDQCVALSVDYWGANPGGDGKDIAGGLISSGKATKADGPVAGGVFSVEPGKNWDSWTTDATAGHTGIVLKVNQGQSIITLENGNPGRGGIMWVQYHPWSTATQSYVTYTNAKP